VLKQLREQTKSLHWVLWLIILSFILLIFVQWGGGGRGGRSSDVWAARVGDEVITAREFYDEFQQQENRLRQLFGAQLRIALEVVIHIAELMVDHGKALEVVANRQLLSHAHAPMDLDRRLADEPARLTDPDLGAGYGLLPGGFVLIQL